MQSRTIVKAVVAALSTAVASAAVAGGGRHHPAAPSSAPYGYDDVYAPYKYRSTGHPVYASPYVGSNLNPSMGGKTGTFGDDGVSGE